MKIVQSFWSGNKSLTTESYGWLSPQYHLISWALSCLNILDYYPDAHLYTDQNGAETLIGNLKLPYKSVAVEYDSIDIKHQHNYAVPKLLSYSKQNQPFIHIDGDVFLFEKLSCELEKAPVIVQNLERGTEYYNVLMKSTLLELTDIPDFLKRALGQPSIMAYNAGLLGGTDYNFINDYANLALELFEKNTVRSAIPKTSSGNYNILFEQILLHTLSIKLGKKVGCFYSDVINDNGYSKQKFADFSMTPHPIKYLHLIGGKKKDPEICNLMSRALLKKNPEVFFRIIDLFQSHHFHYSSRINNVRYKVAEGDRLSRSKSKGNKASIDVEALPLYRNLKTQITKSVLAKQHKQAKQLQTLLDQLQIVIHNCNDISDEELLSFELEDANALEKALLRKGFMWEFQLQKTPNMLIIDEMFDWTTALKNVLFPSIFPAQSGSEEIVVLIPQIFHSAFYEVMIDTLEYNILMLTEQSKTISEIEVALIEHLDINDPIMVEQLHALIIMKIKRLFLNRCIRINDSKSN